MTEGRRGLGLLRAHPAFARLVAAETVSPLGDAMAMLAIVLHVLRTHGTGTSVALVFLLDTLAPLLGPVLGAVADRIDVRRALVLSQVGQAAVVLAMVAALDSYPALLALVFVRGLLAAVMPGAIGSAVSAVVADAELTAANGMAGGAREIGVIIGPPLAGLLFAAGGARPVLLIDAATFAAAIVFLVGLPRRIVDPDPDAGGVLASTIEGLRFIARRRRLVALCLGFWLLVLASAPDDMLLPFLARQVFHTGPVSIGVLMAGASIGLVGGLALVSRSRGRLAPVPTIVLGMTVTAAGNLLTAAGPVVALAVGAQMVRGLGIAVFEPSLRTMIQRSVPREFLGRVFATVYGGVGVAAALGTAAAGPLLDATSARTMFVAIGVAGLLAAGVTAWLLGSSRPDQPTAGS